MQPYGISMYICNSLGLSIPFRTFRHNRRSLCCANITNVQWRSKLNSTCYDVCNIYIIDSVILWSVNPDFEAGLFSFYNFYLKKKTSESIMLPILKIVIFFFKFNTQFFPSETPASPILRNLDIYRGGGLTFPHFFVQEI